MDNVIVYDFARASQALGLQGLLEGMWDESELLELAWFERASQPPNPKRPLQAL